MRLRCFEFKSQQLHKDSWVSEFRLINNLADHMITGSYKSILCNIILSLPATSKFTGLLNYSSSSSSFLFITSTLSLVSVVYFQQHSVIQAEQQPTYSLIPMNN